MQAEAAQLTITTDPDATRAALARMGDTGRAALDDLDSALAALRDDSAGRRTEPTLADLPDLLDRARAAGLPVTLTRLDPAAAAHPASPVGYRIVQEACTNALRHGGRSPTAVDVALEVDVLRLSVRNPMPSGRSARTRPGRGLAGLAERARLAGGALTDAGPTVDGDWLVRAEFPALPAANTRGSSADRR